MTVELFLKNFLLISLLVHFVTFRRLIVSPMNLLL